MTEEQLLSMDVADWESYLLDRSHTRECDPRIGGLTHLSILESWWNTFSPASHLKIYPQLVEAVLRRWSDIVAVPRLDYESDPIGCAASLAFDGAYQFHEYLRPYYDRLWRESPRPHGEQLRWIAVNSGSELPVSRAEIALLFELPDWGLVAIRIAATKGYANDAIELLELLEDRSEEINAFQISWLVHIGFPKLQGLRWLKRFHGDESFAQRKITGWQEQLLAEGIPLEEVMR